MRLAVLLSVLAALVAAAVLGWLLMSGTELVPAGRAGRGPGLEPGAERAALLGDLRTVGFNEPAGGVEVREADAGGAVFAMPGEREIVIAPPPEHRLGVEFVVLSAMSGGFFLEPETDAQAAFYVTFVDARRVLEPPDSRAALAIYEQAAARIREVGKLPFLEGALDVVTVTPVPDAVFYCLKRADGMLFQGATRFVGPLSVTVMRVGDCDPDEGTLRLGAALSLAETALAANR